MENSYMIRDANAKDMPQVMQLIQELADYEKAGNEVDIDADTLVCDGFGAYPSFHCLVAENKKQEIHGFAIFFPKYSTWKGKALYLEDLCVQENMRQNGVGEKLFKGVVAKAQQWNCQRMEWQVLDWNAPAISFYKKMGADLDATWINGKLFPADFKRILGA